jgi:hypothetical protein
MWVESKLKLWNAPQTRSSLPVHAPEAKRARARESRSVAFKNYASVLSGPAQLIGFLGVLYGFARYVFFPEFF